jgi:hypothetical protein
MRMANGGWGKTPFASMLEAMSQQASMDVIEGVGRLRRVLLDRSAGRGQLPLYAYVAVRQLYRTYLALAWEVNNIADLEVVGPAALERLARSQLVLRIHRTAGDFALIERVCRALRPHAEVNPLIAEAEEVLESWAQRDHHLFRVLVPLANFTEELRLELGRLLDGGPDAREELDACLGEAQKAMAPVLRQVSLTAQVLHRLAEELKPLSTDPSGSTSSSANTKEGAMNHDFSSKGPKANHQLEGVGS